jgi:hypothetical protein
LLRLAFIVVVDERANRRAHVVERARAQTLSERVDARRIVHVVSISNVRVVFEQHIVEWIVRRSQQNVRGGRHALSDIVREIRRASNARFLVLMK